MIARPLASRVLLPVALGSPSWRPPRQWRPREAWTSRSSSRSSTTDGKPVKDIVADDILIREDGVDRQVVAVKPASQPISVAVLVDTAQGARVTDAYGTPEEYVRDLRVAVWSLRQDSCSARARTRRSR